MEASMTKRLFVFQTLVFWSTTELEGEEPMLALPIQWLEPMELCITQVNIGGIA